MAEKDPVIEKDLFDGSKVNILGETCEEGQPETKQSYNWRKNIVGRDKQIRFIQTGLHYWYAEEGFGSEKRKTPA